jgi:hypothetical protein
VLCAFTIVEYAHTPEIAMYFSKTFVKRSVGLRLPATTLTSIVDAMGFVQQG